MKDTVWVVEYYDSRKWSRVSRNWVYETKAEAMDERRSLQQANGNIEFRVVAYVRRGETNG